jgi:hypothetical protein
MCPIELDKIGGLNRQARRVRLAEIPKTQTACTHTAVVAVLAELDVAFPDGATSLAAARLMRGLRHPSRNTSTEVAPRSRAVQQLDGTAVGRSRADDPDAADRLLRGYLV